MCARCGKSLVSSNQDGSIFVYKSCMHSMHSRCTDHVNVNSCSVCYAPPLVLHKEVSAVTSQHALTELVHNLVNTNRTIRSNSETLLQWQQAAQSAQTVNGARTSATSSIKPVVKLSSLLQQDRPQPATRSSMTNAVNQVVNAASSPLFAAQQTINNFVSRS